MEVPAQRYRSLAAAACLVLCGVWACRPAADVEERPLRVALQAAPSSLDPHLQDEAVAGSVLANVFEGLIALDRGMRFLPALAERWENPDDLTWIFHLRPGVTFHDGTALLAADVLFSLDRVRSDPGSRKGGYLVAVSSWRAIDAATIEIKTVRPYPILLNKLALVLIVPRGAPTPIERPIGTGPYRLVGRDAAHVELAAYPGYWGGAPRFRRLELAFVNDSAQRVDGLLAGRYDLVTEVAAADLGRLRGASQVRFEDSDTLQVAYLQLRVDRPPFDDPRVREAIHLALDRDALAREMAGGLAAPIGQMVGPNVFGYAPDLKLPLRDLGRARSLLAAAGHPNGVEVELEFRSGRDVEPVRRQLAEAGITVRPRPLPWDALFPRMLAGEPSFYAGTFVCTSADASDLFDAKVHSHDAASGYGSAHTPGVGSTSLDRLIERAAAATDMGDRRRMLGQCMRELMGELTLIPLYVPHTQFGVRRDLQWLPRLDGYVLGREVRRRKG